jgi:uroporphyrinogen decarboxylase
MKAMDHRERVVAALRGEAVDHPPVALWRHFPETDQAAGTLAASHLAFQKQFDFDFLKVTPASGYHGDDWGLRGTYRPNREGVRTYGSLPVKKPSDWRGLADLDVRNGVYGRELEALRLIRKGVGPDLPVLATLFSPLSVARTLAGESALVRLLREDPASLRAGLETITGVAARFAAACLGAGADGIFFSTQMARENLLSREEYREFGLPFDRRVFEAASAARLILLHAHGEGIYFDLFLDAPVGAINWHDRRTPPTLAEARKLTSRCLAGGINEATFADRPAREVSAEVRDAVARTGGRGHIVTPGCVIPIDSPEENIRAAVAAARAGI